MLSIERARIIEPELQDLTDEEVLDILNDMCGLGQLAFEKWTKEKDVSKNPEWSLPSNK